MWPALRGLRRARGSVSAVVSKNSTIALALLSRTAAARISLSGLAYIVFAFLASSVALSETRMALVIGNATYKLSPLTNPANDARLMNNALTRAGFKVTLLLNADQAVMKQAIVKFGRALRKSDSVGLFYYAGHGVQIDGENYLIPIGADIADTSEVALAGVSLNELLRTMQRSSSRLNIAILDACRDNPFPAPTRSIARGLASVRAPTGTLIAYATGPGEVAYDGNSRNSPYTRALAAAIPIVGISLEEVFRRTRRQVLAATQSKQTPWEHSSLTGEFFFHPKRTAPEGSDRVGAATGDADLRRLAELDDWERIRESTDKSLFDSHLARYPDGVFAELAAMKRDALAEEQNWPWAWVTTGSVETASARSQAQNVYERAVRLAAKPGVTSGDKAEAARLYRQAAELGLPAAMYALGRSYDRGHGLTRDLGRAAHWYARAADEKHAPAMAALATMYEYGEGVRQDLASALRYYRVAAEAGDAHAMAGLGYLFATGKGVARDVGEARRWYKKAAAKGLPRAMYNLALMYLRERFENRRLAEAVGLLEQAAAKGHAKSMRQLAYLYDEGRGVARSHQRAAEMLLQSIATAGSESAGISRPGSWSLGTRREIQRQLTRRGLYKGPAHGAINLATRSALRKLASTD